MCWRKYCPEKWLFLRECARCTCTLPAERMVGCLVGEEGWMGVVNGQGVGLVGWVKGRIKGVTLRLATGKKSMSSLPAQQYPHSLLDSLAHSLTHSLNPLPPSLEGQIKERENTLSTYTSVLAKERKKRAKTVKRNRDRMRAGIVERGSRKSDPPLPPTQSHPLTGRPPSPDR